MIVRLVCHPTRIIYAVREISVFAWLSLSSIAWAGPMAAVPAGDFRPFYTNDGTTAVAAFRMDVAPVTNGEFLEFVRAQPMWQRSKVPSLFADKRYLGHWAGDEELGELAPSNSPVTHVSWFAARAYAEWAGKRLPTLTEWEYAAAGPMASGPSDPPITQRLLAWYNRRVSLPVPVVRSTAVNEYGIWDLHGLIWEWVEDFNAIPVSSRADSANDPSGRNFCGGGAVGVDDVNNYAAFMRYAFRSSLSAKYTVSSLGFRCAANREEYQ